MAISIIMFLWRFFSYGLFVYAYVYVYVCFSMCVSLFVLIAFIR